MVRYTFCRWIGGKEWLWKLLKPYLVIDRNPIYIEPFLGGGAIALHYIKWCRKHRVTKQFILSDTNSGLINAYVQIRDNFECLRDFLDELDVADSTKELYNERRNEYNSIPKNDVRSAALFIWLMANSWRGLYRVNRNGQYNTPFGEPKAKCYNAENLLSVHHLLQDVKIRCCSYTEVPENGLIYMDPPYVNVYQQYSLMAPTNEEINNFIRSRVDRATILISNNQHFIPPDDAELLIHTSVCERAETYNGSRRNEYVWRCSANTV